MQLDIAMIGPDKWNQYAHVQTEYPVRSVYDCQVRDGGLGGIVLAERIVAETDRVHRFDADDVPGTWAKQFDLPSWGIFLATMCGRPVGGAAVAPPNPALWGIERRTDAAALFDIRVSGESRRQGVGKALLDRCAVWAKDRGFRFLVIETQNENVPACRFYAASGAELIEIRRLGYAQCPDVAHQAMLIWQLAL